MTLAEELHRMAEKAGFTKRDMAVWLDVTQSRAVDRWFDGTMPNTPLKYKHVVRRLDLLKKVLSGKIPLAADSFPIVPINVSQNERKAYIEKVLKHALDSVPKPHYSERRV